MISLRLKSLINSLNGKLLRLSLDIILKLLKKNKYKYSWSTIISVCTGKSD